MMTKDTMSPEDRMAMLRQASDPKVTAGLRAVDAEIRAMAKRALAVRVTELRARAIRDYALEIRAEIGRLQFGAEFDDDGYGASLLLRTIAMSAEGAIDEACLTDEPLKDLRESVLSIAAWASMLLNRIDDDKAGPLDPHES